MALGVFCLDSAEQCHKTQKSILHGDLGAVCHESCRLSRSILADKPRVTRFPVEFDPVEAVPPMGGEAAPDGATAGPPAVFGGEAMDAGMQQQV